MTTASSISVESLVDCAVSLEKQALAFYQKMAGLQKDARLKELYESLAKEEQAHEKVFERLLNDLSGQKTQPTEAQNNYMNKLCKSLAFPNETQKNQELNSDLEIVDYAISREKEAVFFYHEMKNYLLPTDYLLIDEIILEERLHIVKLLDIKEKYS